MSMQTGRFLVNRNAEKALLDDLLQPAARQRILLLQAGSGYGKSLLLETYQADIEDRGHALAVIKLDRGGVDAVDLLAALCHQWGWARFPRFHTALSLLAMPATVEVSRNVQIGFSRSQINLPENPAQRRAQMHELALAWFEDVQAGLPADRPAVILIDTYNRAGTAERLATVSEELHGWMEDGFLIQVQHTPALRLILAGQQVPESGLTSWERCCRRHVLGPIRNPDDWQRFAEHVGARVTREIISAYCHTEGGHPYAIALKLTLLCNWSFSL